MKNKYRVKPYDCINDIWILQKRYFYVFWVSCGVGPKKVVEKKASELNLS